MIGRKNVSLENRIKGGMMGVAVGDALGATLEFLGKNEGFKEYGLLTEIIGGGFMNLKPGETTDDTAMTIAVAKGILKNKKNPQDAIGDQFMKWYHSNPIDIGISCRATFKHKDKYSCTWDQASLFAHMETGRKSAGNGTLMRCLPVALAYSNKDKMEEITIMQSKMTHYDDMASDACVMYNNIVSEFLRGRTNKEKVIADHALVPTYGDIFDLNYDDLNPSGFVIDTFKCALWAFLNTKTFEECIIMACNLAGDADTIGAIAGGMAGAYYGYDKIPHRWIEKIILKKEILELSNKLFESRK